MEHTSIYLKPKLNNSKLDDRSGYQYSIQVLNDSKDDISCMHRSNIPSVIRGASLQMPTHNRITIRTIHTFYTPQAIADTRNLLHDRWIQMKHFVCEDSKIIYDIMTSGQLNQQFCHIKIDRIITIKDLQQHGALYINDVDLMLYSNNYKANKIHPYSQYAIGAAIGDEIAERYEAVGIMIQIVDNDEKIARRFGYMCNQIVEVPVLQDQTKESGIYVHRISNGESIHTRHSLIDMESLGLYPTEEQAITNGNPDLVHQKEMLELKKQLDKAKVELAEKEIKNRQEHEEFMRQQEQKRCETKDHYEERSYSRKSEYESLKVGASILAIVLSIVAIAKKA